MPKNKKKKKVAKKVTVQSQADSVIDTMISEDFVELYNVLHEFRKKLVWNSMLGFVRGLRFSARLIYIIRKRLKGKPLTVDWGHIVDKAEKKFSRECDIIIYNGKIAQSWNGHNGEGSPVMSFKFIASKDVAAVISCKSMIRGSDIDKEFLDDVKEYSRNIYLFAECCPKGKFEAIRTKAIEAGYKKFWCLYEWDPKKPEYAERREPDWRDFTSSVAKFR